MSDDRDRTITLGVRLAGLIGVIAIALAVFANLSGPYQMDFLSYWAAAVLTTDNAPQLAYDLTAHHAVQRRALALEGLLPFAYPPPFLLLIWPLGLLSYSAAAAFWISATFVAFALALSSFHRGRPWNVAAFPPVLTSAFTGQSGLLTGALFASGLSMVERRPLLAGAVLGCLVIKPQLAILLPLALAAGGHWRAFIATGGTASGLLLLSLAVFGPAPFQAMIQIAPTFGSIAADGLTGWHKMASVYAALRLAGAPALLAWATHIAVAGAAAAAVLWVWRSPGELAARIAVLAAGTMLISPYLYLYDGTILLLPVIWLWQRREDRPVVALAVAFLFVGLLQNWALAALPSPTAAASLLLLGLSLRRVRAGSSSTSRRALSPAIA